VVAQPVVEEPVAEEAVAEDAAVPDETVDAGPQADEHVDPTAEDEAPPTETPGTGDAEPVDEVEQAEPDEGGDQPDEEHHDVGEPDEPGPSDAGAAEHEGDEPEREGDEAEPDEVDQAEPERDEGDEADQAEPGQDEGDQVEPEQDAPDDGEPRDEVEPAPDRRTDAPQTAGAGGRAEDDTDDDAVAEDVETEAVPAEPETSPDERAVVDAGAAENADVDEPVAPAEAEGTPGPVKDPRGAWRRLLLAGSPRATRANVLALVLAGTLGFAIIAQVRQTSIQGLENLREDELVRIFAGVDQDGERLADDIRGLESSLQLLQSQSTNDAEAQRAAQERLDALGILAGTAPARGPGIVLTIRDPDLEVTSPVILDAIQELRDAGAEAIQIGDQRVVASTWFSQTDAGISVSGTELRPPYVIRAIGDGNTLAGAMEIPGGVSATVRRAGGETDVQIRDELDVGALLTLTPPQYAQPVPTSTP
jgi:uncharacterized protein YlxW (UPF0749 family)